MAKKQSEGKPSSEFLEREKLILLDRELSRDKHDWKMQEFEYLRTTEKMKHEWELERGRIKSAEIRKVQMRKQEMRADKW